MGRISAFESITLDGVMQGLGRADEDTRGGFTHGGWGEGYQDEVMAEFAGEGMSHPGAMLFGHRSYVDLLGHWTSVPDPNPYADHLVSSAKYVVSRSADTQLAYPHSTLLAGEATEQIPAILDRMDGDLTIIGSGDLVRSLHAAGLIDTYTLLIHPIVLGSGTTLFADGDRSDLTLVRSQPTTTGVIIAQYTTR